MNYGEYSTNVREHSGHNRHAGHSVATFRDKFWVSLGLTIPVVVWSSEVQHWLGYRAPTFPGSRFIPAHRIKLFVGGISTDYDIMLFRSFGIRNSLQELDEIKPVIKVLAGNRGGALKLEARVLDALANERLDFGKAALEPP